MTVLGAGCGQGSASDDQAMSQVQDTASDETADNAGSDAEDQVTASETAAENIDPKKDNSSTEPAPAEASQADEVIEADDPDDADAAGSDNADTADEDLTKRDLFADFIMGKDSGKVADDFFSEMVMTDPGLKSGEAYTVSELKDLLAKDEMFASVDPSVSYAPLSSHDEFLYVLRLGYKMDYDEFNEYFIYSDHSGELELKFAIDGWSRRSIFINDAGIVFDSGSNGAGSHSSVIYAPDKSFSYKMVSSADEQYYGYSFYDDNDQPIEALNSTIEEAAAGNQAAMDVAYYRERINGKDYFYYLGGASKITQDTVDYIDGIAKKHGFTFDGKAAADEARNAYEKELGIEADVKVEKEAYWKTL